MFGGMYTLSPFMGCSHGCVYCNGGAEKYHMVGDFARNIKVRTNIYKLLQMELPKLREKATIHFSSGISDYLSTA